MDVSETCRFQSSVFVHYDHVASLYARAFLLCGVKSCAKCSETDSFSNPFSVPSELSSDAQDFYASIYNDRSIPKCQM
uniref:ZP domain-containing protein n=1 Tax=Steinernema glaseri TaxID=37863 RepID=A0A1I7ZD35_9BILA